MLTAVRLRHHHRGCYSEQIPAGIQVIHIERESESGAMSVIRGPPGRSLDVVIQQMTRADPNLEILARSRGVLVVRSASAGCHMAAPRLLGNDVTMLWPVVFEDGFEWFRIMTPFPETFVASEASGDLSVDHVTPLTADDLARLRPLGAGLSARQREVLQLAIQRGYYQTPRAATIAGLAKELGLSRATVQEHLQRAVSSVMAVYGGSRSWR